MRAILVGAVESSRVALEAFRRSKACDLELVITLPPEKAGRHSDFVDLSDAAAGAGAALATVDNINRPEALERLRGVGADYLFVIGWSQIFGEEVLASFPDRVIGYHPAPLPRMRGRAAIPWTILKQEPITAGTLLWLDKGIDSGPILDQEFFHVAEDETAASLYEKHMRALATMLDRSLDALAAGRARMDAQDESHATWAARRTQEDGRIDWRCRAEDIDRLVRAAGKPYPGAFTELDGERLVIWSSTTSSGGRRHAALPGQIIELTNDGSRMVVACGDSTALDISEWEYHGATNPRLHSRLGGTR